MRDTQLLAVLMTGATIEWPCEYKLVGDPKKKNIYTYEEGAYTGLWNMDLAGVRECIKEKRKLEQEKFGSIKEYS
jgi:hypothetical protein